MAVFLSSSSISISSCIFPLSHSFKLPLTRHTSSLSLSSSSSSSSLSSSSSMELSSEENQSQFMKFPHVSTPHKNLMVDLVSAMENRLASELLPCAVPPDLQSYQNGSGSARGSLFVRRGHNSSLVDFMLGSWLHCQLPTGGALNITSLSSYLKSSTDAPHFLIELIQSTPTSLVLILDLTPRKDLVCHPDYLSIFYEDTKLDSYKQALNKLPEAQPYLSPSLYIRCLVSPTAIVFRIETEAGKDGRMEEIVENHISPVAKEVLGIWLDQCACKDRCVEETERKRLEERDEIIKRKTVEIDIGSSFPRLFGAEIANRVLDVLREVYGV